MKILAPLCLIVLMFAFSNCKKTTDVPTPINCNGLVTDTTGSTDSLSVFVPSAFSPNADGLNDMFRPLYRYDSTRLSFTVDFKIYDEYNNVVYSDLTKWGGWQPSIPDNTLKKYYYRLQVVTSSNHKIGKCGYVYPIKNCLPANFDKTQLSFWDQLTENGFNNPTTDWQILSTTCP